MFRSVIVLKVSNNKCTIISEFFLSKLQFIKLLKFQDPTSPDKI